MAANRFATMLHRNTNKITLILIYAVLEWILIVLLLLNSLFSYLILKFAEFFGLKPPCPWCARIDHIFDPSRGNRNMNMDLLCELHAKEVSRLVYCSNHQKLIESRELCEDCLSSRPELHGFSLKNSGLFPLMKGCGKFQNGEEKLGENGEVSLNCSCCGVSLNYNNDNKYSAYVLLKTSSCDVLECAQKENLVSEARDYDDNHESQLGFDSVEKNPDFGEKGLKDENVTELNGKCEKGNENETVENGCVTVTEYEWQEFEGGEVEKVQVVLEAEDNNSTLVMVDKSVQVCVDEESPVIEASNQHLEFFLDYSGHTLVPIELIDSKEEHKSVENDVGAKDHEFISNSEAEVKEREELIDVESGGKAEKTGMFLDVDINEEPNYAMLESMEMEEDENSLVFHAKGEQMSEEFGNFRVFPLIRWSSGEAADAQEQHEDVHIDNVACEEEVAQPNNENEADVSIGTEIPDLDITDEMVQIQDSVVHVHEDPPISSANLYNHGLEVEEQMAELRSISVQDNDHMTNNLDIEEDKVPDTPTSVDSLNQLHKKLPMLEKRDSGAEESLDGSVTSELDGCDGVVTIERLKSALRSERKNLNALYAELEEERSASAVAANQTMAMINRLQEEKAGMQMEALQYQRMMEEQSEYDQEALQLLNELMVKREKEKQELERELEVCRKKLLDYEMKEKTRLLRKSKDGSSRSGFSSVSASASASASCSNGEESDGMSIDLNQEAKEEEGYFGHNQEYGDDNQNTPIEAVVSLEESLADFEEERLSILEQLKVLEEKLLTLDDEGAAQHFEDVKENGHANGFLTNGKNCHKKIAGKSLLPLFDAICDENGDRIMNGNGIHDSYDSKLEVENKKLEIEEEVDHLYERLQALEADREFLKHCISSLKKGDKGMDLLREILQHLRDLRSVELRVRKLSDDAII